VSFFSDTFVFTTCTYICKNNVLSNGNHDGTNVAIRHRPIGDAKISIASQIPHITWNINVHYCVHCRYPESDESTPHLLTYFIITYFNIILQLAPTSSFCCEWKRRRPNVEDSWEHNEEAVADNRQGIAFLLRVWEKGWQLLTLKIKNVTKWHFIMNKDYNLRLKKFLKLTSRILSIDDLTASIWQHMEQRTLTETTDIY
jgi:hypothetical protein